MQRHYIRVAERGDLYLYYFVFVFRNWSPRHFILIAGPCDSLIHGRVYPQKGKGLDISIMQAAVRKVIYLRICLELDISKEKLQIEEFAWSIMHSEVIDLGIAQLGFEIRVSFMK